MARNRPVRICRMRHTPNREPKFHQAEILEGVGKSMNDSLMILISGCDLRVLVIKFL